jgi:hypothetical protein
MDHFKRLLIRRFDRARMVPLVGCLHAEPKATCGFSLRVLFAAMTFFAVYFGTLAAMKIFRTGG